MLKCAFEGSLVSLPEMYNYKNARDSLDNLIGQNVNTWGVLTDGMDIAYQNQSSAYVPAVRQLFCATQI